MNQFRDIIENADTNNLTNIATNAISSFYNIFHNFLWIVSLLVAGTIFYAGISTYRKIKEKKENKQDMPMVSKFGKILQNVIIAIVLNYVILGMFAYTFAQQNNASKPTFQSTWNAIVIKYFEKIIINSEQTDNNLPPDL